MTEEPIAEKKPPFYEKVEKPDGGTANLVSDPDAAQELAGLEDTQGRDAALGREAELEREHETGLTDKERANIELMDGLKEKYPDAFEDTLDDKNRRLLILKRGDVNSRKEDAVYTQLGHFSVTAGKPAENLNLTVVQDMFLPENRTNDSYNISPTSGGSPIPVRLERLTLSNPDTRNNLKHAHEAEQATQIEIAQTQKAEEKPPTPQEILSEL